MSGNGGEAFDSEAAVSRGLGAFFGMILGNAALIVVALLLKRVTRSRGESSKDDLELKNGKRKVPADIEAGNLIYDDRISNTRISERPKSSSGQVHVNDGFEEIDLDHDTTVKDDHDTTVKDDRLYEAPLKHEKDEDNEPYASLTSKGITTQPGELSDEQSDEQPDEQRDEVPNKQLDEEPDNQSDKQLDEEPDNQPDKQLDDQPEEQSDVPLDENHHEQDESNYENVNRNTKTTVNQTLEADVFY